jgi:enhancing lycopene biosynthesis protein 2
MSSAARSIKKRIAVILSGCGFKDGAEITEAVSVLVGLSELGAEYKVFAPNVDFTATNHMNGDSQETRNTLTESARVARGDIEDLEKLQSQDFDGIVFPGGYGAALHLCDFAQKGPNCSVHPKVEKTIRDFFEESKPIGAICIAPVLIARVLGDKGVNLTIGNDPDTAAALEKMGAQHVNCEVQDYVTDRECKVISTPAYMYEAQPHQVFQGVSSALKELFEMA